MKFQFTTTALEGLVEVQRIAVQDVRGFFSRFYCADELAAAGFTRPIAQINHTLTRRAGTVRGLHFQRPPHAETKMVSCLRGEVWDVAVDLRAGSPTFLQWHACLLSADNRRSLLIPEGFAHGFQALQDDCELIYLHTASYYAEAEGAVHVNDDAVGIDWPLPIAELSERDRTHPMLNDTFEGIAL